MRKPLYIRALTEEERQAIEAGLRASDAFTLRRCQVLLASAAGKKARQIGEELHVDTDTALNAIRAFNERGLASLQRGSSRPKRPRIVLPTERRDAMKALLHQSPRAFDREHSRWTLDLLSEVAFEQGVASRELTRSGMLRTLRRLGIAWQRAKQWLESPDPEYARKKADGTG